MRYLNLILFFCLLFLAGAAHAQCDIQLNSQVTNVTCFGSANGAINLSVSNGTGPYTYEWSNTVSVEDPSGLTAGVYSVTVTDILACTATTSVTVTQPTQLQITSTGGTITCVTPALTIQPTVSGGTVPYAYLWSNGATTQDLQLATPGLYGVTVTDAEGCTATSQVTIFVDNNIPNACIFPPQTLTCNISSIVLDGSCSSGINNVYTWSTASGLILSGENTPTPTISEQGSYSLTVTNTANGCTNVATVNVFEDIVSPLVNAGPDLEIPCGNSALTLIGSGSTGNLFTYLWTGPGIISGGNTENPIVNAAGVYTIIVTNITNGCTASDQMIVTTNASGLCSQISGFVRIDTLENCQSDPGEPPMAGRIVQAVGAQGAYYGLTDATGAYTIFVPAGDTYAVTAVPPSVLWASCPAIPDVAAPDANQTYPAADILFQKLAGCPLLSVDMSSGNLRRCFNTNFFHVLYCNDGTEPAVDAYVVVTLDSFLSPVSSSIPYTDLGNHQLRFDVGNVAPGECGTFYFYILLSCDAALGQTHCTEAHIYPDSSCLPNNAQWTGASLRISGECQADSVLFRIENVGTGNMTHSLDYIVIEDQVMFMMAPVLLGAGEYAQAKFPANGSTWRLEMEQEPFHPGHSAPAISVEGCTTGTTFSTGFVTQFPTDDQDVFLDILCVENTGSFDPNDKQGFPKGYGDAHYIRPGTPLEYMIRFQNTGNDTAFTVRVVDTLSAWLDPTTLRPGAASHPFTWSLSGAGVLTYTFDQILLPDSNINEVASHGFLKFTIHPKADAPLETLIENTADIYFDFNAPVVTNTTYHRLGENFISVGTWQPAQPLYAVSVMPNPMTTDATLFIKGLRREGDLQLLVYDLQGKPVLAMDSETAQFQLKKGNLASGIYLFRVEQAGVMVGSGKLLVGQ